MLAHIADLRLCALMSLRTYVLAPLCPFALMALRTYVTAPLCLHPYVVDRHSQELPKPRVLKPLIR